MSRHYLTRTEPFFSAHLAEFPVGKALRGTCRQYNNCPLRPVSENFLTAPDRQGAAGMCYHMTMGNDHGDISVETTVGAGDFKSKCLQLLDDVATHRESLIITKRGKPVARLVPMPLETQLFGAMAGSVLDESDVLTPIDIEWSSAR